MKSPSPGAMPNDCETLGLLGTVNVDVRQGLNYFQRGVGALPIQWPMVEIYELRCHAKIRDFMQVITAVF